jgi:hypothetical protein
VLLLKNNDYSMTWPQQQQEVGTRNIEAAGW